jgi:hypothetical protein
MVGRTERERQSVTLRVRRVYTLRLGGDASPYLFLPLPVAIHHRDHLGCAVDFLRQHRPGGEQRRRARRVVAGGVFVEQRTVLDPTERRPLEPVFFAIDLRPGGEECPQGCGAGIAEAIARLKKTLSRPTLLLRSSAYSV